MEGAELSGPGAAILKIPALFSARADRFTCLVANKAGTISRDFFVSVIGKDHGHSVKWEV